jgi:hypothetical protein
MKKVTGFRLKGLARRFVLLLKFRFRHSQFFERFFHYLFDMASKMFLIE